MNVQDRTDHDSGPQYVGSPKVDYNSFDPTGSPIDLPEEPTVPTNESEKEDPATPDVPTPNEPETPEVKPDNPPEETKPNDSPTAKASDKEPEQNGNANELIDDLLKEDPEESGKGNPDDKEGAQEDDKNKVLRGKEAFQAEAASIKSKISEMSYEDAQNYIEKLLSHPKKIEAAMVDGKARYVTETGEEKVFENLDEVMDFYGFEPEKPESKGGENGEPEQPSWKDDPEYKEALDVLRERNMDKVITEFSEKAGVDAKTIREDKAIQNAMKTLKFDPATGEKLTDKAKLRLALLQSETIQQALVEKAAEKRAKDISVASAGAIPASGDGKAHTDTSKMSAEEYAQSKGLY